MGAPGRHARPEVSVADDDHRLEKHSLAIAGHRTSVTLERVFWQALRRIAGVSGRSVSELVADIDRRRSELEPPPNLSSAIRVFVLNEGAKDER